MNNEEAIEALEKVGAAGAWWPSEYYTALDMGIAALEKQIPKNAHPKQVLHHNGYLEDYWCCDNCECFLATDKEIKEDNYVKDHQVTYCPNCGQAIDWWKVWKEDK